jgi:hypothetical protein
MHPASPKLADNGQPGGLIWRLQPERPVRAVAVVMLDAEPKGPLKVAAPNEQPVQALGTDRPHPALRVNVRLGRPHRREEHLGALGADYVIEAAGELRVMVADKGSTAVVPARPAPAASCGPAG